MATSLPHIQATLERQHTEQARQVAGARLAERATHVRALVSAEKASVA